MSSKYSPERCLKRRQRLGYCLQLLFGDSFSFERVYLETWDYAQYEEDPMKNGRAFARGRCLSQPPAEEDPLKRLKVCNLTKAENEDIRLLWGEYTLPEFGHARR